MIVLALMAALLTGASHEEARYVMGTMAVVRAEAPAGETAVAAVDAAFAEMTRLESIMSTWREDTEISRLKAAVPGSWTTVSPELGEVLAAALDVAAASDGAFDPTVLPLVKTWGLRTGALHVPTPAVLDSLRQRVGYRLVEVAGNRIRFLRAGVELDLGGVAKGFALDRARSAMIATGATAGVLDLGGSLLVFGPRDADSVGIVAPDDPARRVATVQVRDACVATSGQYERYVEIDGHRYGHILDPRTGRSVDRRGSVTVVAREGWLADALATAAFVLGPEAGAGLVARYQGASCVFVSEDGRGGWVVTRHPRR